MEMRIQENLGPGGSILVLLFPLTLVSPVPNLQAFLALSRGSTSTSTSSSASTTPAQCKGEGGREGGG